MFIISYHYNYYFYYKVVVMIKLHQVYGQKFKIGTQFDYHSYVTFILSYPNSLNF